MNKAEDSLGAIVLQDQRAELIAMIFDHFISPRLLKRLIAIKPLVWTATLALPLLSKRIPILNLFPPYVMANLVPQFFDELKLREKSFKTPAEEQGKSSLKGTTIREAMGMLNNTASATEFITRLKTLGEQKQKDLLNFQVNPRAAKGWIIFLALVKKEEFENAVDILMDTKTKEQPAKGKINVLAEIAKGVYPSLEKKLENMEVGLRNHLIAHLEALPAEEAFGYMERLEEMGKDAFARHIKLIREGDSLYQMYDQAKRIGKNVVKTLVNFHNDQQPADVTGLFGKMKKTFNRGRALAR
jgi:hypothetical protein